MSGRLAPALKPRCAKCIFLLSPALIHSSRETTEPPSILPLCLNHARTPGVVREVHPCECCRNFEARREPDRGTAPPPGPEVKYIPLGDQRHALVDAADFDWLNQHPWRLLGTEAGLGYAYRYERGKKVFMHRAIMQTPPDEVVDHKNHNPSDNRRSNLRNCTRQQNRCNQRPRGSKSGFVGVYPQGKKWRAEIHSGGKIVYREVFDDPVQAAKARDREVHELFGPFAFLNFPEEIHGQREC